MILLHSVSFVKCTCNSLIDELVGQRKKEVGCVNFIESENLVNQ